MRYVFLAIILLTLLAAGFYAYLGGTRTPTVTLETTAAPVYLAGQAFRGPPNSEKFGQLFRQAKDAQARLRGDLANLYLRSPETAHDTIQAFIGLAVADTTQGLPTGFRYRVVPAGQRVLAARLRGVSYLLAPNKLYPAAFDAIKEQKLTPTGNFYLEKFGADDASEVWIGVK
ncbi:GyrI-like domain-containing protein [Hymenobacter properus]|uniref:GyrI-like domain-containing protein n=1 Tax=Hymenobacter properus TaxID=2791026 RepID=A0A931BMB4_9BACT|nr:GyrI-like domain-containing protein [Hymenobacter properus]MBF9142893.1 GyrI-like domain-containing protein [Hymenobacter properus]MBR7721700.1 GyrI-like domain-containing protein [Microvirga sp. SRT04]